MTTKDNWIDKSEGMVCNTCMWFVEKQNQNYSGDNMKGRCRKHCPVVQEGWPVVFKTDWCGDHKLK
jgi:hypothetical protein